MQELGIVWTQVEPDLFRLTEMWGAQRAAQRYENEIRHYPVWSGSVNGSEVLRVCKATRTGSFRAYVVGDPTFNLSHHHTTFEAFRPCAESAYRMYIASKKQHAEGREVLA